jgi:DNA-binding winged helix-turn-helix (wHTH) protein
MRKSFGNCKFDSETRQLWRGRTSVALSPKALDLLELLLAQAPRAVSKEEIQSALWPGTFVSEANLTNLISEVRAAIGETARRPRCIRTVHRFGYAFDGELNEEHSVRDSPQPVLYRLVLGRRRITLEPGENILGRHPDAEVRIDQTSVSRRHARISIRAGKATLEDLDSRNGTFLHGRRLEKPAAIHDGDVIGLGPISMIFRVFSDVDSTEAAPPDE